MHCQRERPGPPILLCFQAKSHRELSLVLLHYAMGLPPACRGFLGMKAALARSLSSDARSLALSMLLSLAHPSQSVWSQELLLCFLSRLSLNLSTDVISLIACVRKKSGSRCGTGVA